MGETADACQAHFAIMSRACDGITMEAQALLAWSSVMKQVVQDIIFCIIGTWVIHWRLGTCGKVGLAVP